MNERTHHLRPHCGPRKVRFFGSLAAHVLLALFFVSQPAISGGHRYLWVDDALDESQRQLVAKELLRRAEKYDGIVPTLAPKEIQYIEEELAFAGENLGSARTRNFMKSSLYRIWLFRGDLDPLLEALRAITSGAYSSDKEEIRAWAFVALHLMRRGLSEQYMKLLLSGAVQSLDSPALPRMFGAQVLEKMVIERL